MYGKKFFTDCAFVHKSGTYEIDSVLDEIFESRDLVSTLLEFIGKEPLIFKFKNTTKYMVGKRIQSETETISTWVDDRWVTIVSGRYEYQNIYKCEWLKSESEEFIDIIHELKKMIHDKRFKEKWHLKYIKYFSY